jgi:VWFA-related protein
LTSLSKHTPRLPSALALSLFFIVTLSARALAQAPSPPPPTAADATAVRLELMLTGGNGRPAAGLKREDVRVFVDGVERPVVHFEKDEVPVSYGLVVDNSASLKSQFGEVIAASKAAVAKVTDEDEAFVVRFVAADTIRLLQNMTSDKAALGAALDAMFIEGGQTALLDALYLAGDYLQKNARPAGAGGRRLTLLLITDGEERNSFYKTEAVLKLLKGGGVQVNCIGLTGELDRERGFTTPDKRTRARDLLTKIAKETGGRVFFAEKPGELEEAVAEAVENMRTRYVVAYEPPAQAAGKGRGKVEVKLVGAPAKERLKAVVVSPVKTPGGGSK